MRSRSRSRSRSPRRQDNRSARNMLHSSIEPIRFKKATFGRYSNDRRSFHSYDDRDRRYPLNRHDRRAHLRTREYEESKKPMLVLDDPSRVPRGSLYFEHDHRESIPVGRSSFRSDDITSSSDNRSHREERRTSRDRDNRRRNEKEQRSDYYGYRSDPFVRNSPLRRSFRHHEPYRPSYQHDDRRDYNRRDSFQQQKRQRSPDVWQHDKFEELEKSDNS